MKMRSQKKILATLITALAMGTASMTTWASPEETNRIASIQVAKVGVDVVLAVELDRPFTGDVAGFVISNPAQIALDFPGTIMGVEKTRVVNEGVLRSFNAIEANGRTRLVLNLTERMNYDIKKEGNRVLISLSKSLPGAIGVVPETLVPSGELSGAPALEDIMFRRGQDGEARLIVSLNRAKTGVQVKRQGSRLHVDFSGVQIPNHLLKRLDVNDFATPMNWVETRRQGNDVRITMTPKGNWEYNTYQSDREFVIEVRKQVEDPNKLAQGSKGQYSGPKVSINYHNGELRAMLRMMAEELGLNAVISESVQGTTTLVLKDVPADQVLDILFDQKGLGMQKNGNVVMIAPREEIAAKDKQKYDAAQQKNDLEPLIRETFSLNYQKAGAVAQMLNGLSISDNPSGGANQVKADLTNPARILSKRGSAVADGVTNSLFVNDTPSKLDEVRDFIKKVDVPTRQVLIEARVVEANDKFGRNLGTRLNFGSDQIRRIGKTGAYYSDVTASSNLPSFDPTGGLFNISLFNADLSNVLKLELAAMDAEGAGKIVSTPRVLTTNNQKALIEDGLMYPVRKPATANEPSTVEHIPIKLLLETVPMITPDGDVKMKVLIKKEDINCSISVDAVCAYDSSVINTEAIVQNGGTMVVGGVFKSKNDQNTEKVPFFGDLPYVGWLFKYQEKTTDVRELMIFITPKIIDEGVSM